MSSQEASAIAAELLPHVAKLACALVGRSTSRAADLQGGDAIRGSLTTADLSRLVQQGTIRTLRALETVAMALVVASSSVSQSSSRQNSRSRVPDFLPPILTDCVS